MAKPRFIDDPNVKRWMKQHATSAAAVIPVSMRDYGELYWIKPALWQFIQRGLVTDLLQVVRPGKEATVYLCQAGPLLDLDFLALKAYSPTMMRRFTNDATYQTGHARGGFQLLLRDIERLRDYFAPYGLSIHPERLAGRLWSRYHRGQLTRPPEQTAPATAHISG